MSFLKELEELAAKLAPAGAAPSAGAVKLVDHDHWDHVVKVLGRAKKRLARAAAALREAADGSTADGSPVGAEDRATDPVRARVLAEVAVDLSRESDDLMRRAKIRRELAPKKPPAASSAPVAPADETKPGERGAVEKPSARQEHAVHAPEPGSEEEPETSGQLGIKACVHELDVVQKELAQAIEDASDGVGDVPATGFVEDLDVLEEMTLGLRRRVDEISGVPVD